MRLPALRRSRLPLVRLAQALLLVCLSVTTLHAAQTTAPDFSGAWRLDDANSDTAETLTAMLRKEARNEQAAPLPPASNARGQSHPGGSAGGHGSGHAHGMGGGGMGHGHSHRSNADSSSTASTSQDPIASEQFALPPLLNIDSVLLVQQANMLQIQLDNGEQLQVRLDGQTRQSLNGDAMVHARFDANDLHITIRYADGTELEQDWARASDGRHLTIIGWWKLPTLQQPIRFRRSYLAVG